MAVWLVRAGAKGEHEQKFLTDSRIYLTKKLNIDVSGLSERSELIELMTEVYAGDKPRKVSNLASQVWSFAHVMQVEDWVVLPSKFEPVVYVGKIKADYHYDGSAEHPYYHWRTVDWQPMSIERSKLPQQLLRSLSAAMTICQLKNEDAVKSLQQVLSVNSVN